VGESDKLGGRCRADGRVGLFNFDAWRVLCSEESRGDWASVFGLGRDIEVPESREGGALTREQYLVVMADGHSFGIERNFASSIAKLSDT
jgi:hypothetical protein